MCALRNMKTLFILVAASLITSVALPQQVIGTLHANGAVTLAPGNNDNIEIPGIARNARNSLDKSWKPVKKKPNYLRIRKTIKRRSSPDLNSYCVETGHDVRIYSSEADAIEDYVGCEKSMFWGKSCAVFSSNPKHLKKYCEKLRGRVAVQLRRCSGNCTKERQHDIYAQCRSMIDMECSRYDAVIGKARAARAMEKAELEALWAEGNRSQIANESARAKKAEASAMKEKELAQKAQLTAELATIESENSARDAAIQREEAVIAWNQADKNAATMRVEKRCMRAFLQQVKKEVPCVGSTVTVPDGMMIHWNPYTAGVEAYMCPSPSACKGMRVWKGITQPESTSGMDTCPLAPTASSLQQIQVHGSLSSTSLCERGYDASQPGCVTCENDYGRNNMDPFICSKCGNSALQWNIFFLKPIALFVVGLRGGMQKRTESVTNDLLKICLGYGAVDSIVMQVLSVSKAYASLSEEALILLGYAESMSHATSVLYSPSIDCLLGEKVGINKKLATTLAMPILLFEVWFIVACLRFIFKKCSFKLDMLVAIIVLGNQFLPEVAAGCMRAVPCFHTQKHIHAEDFLAYETFEKCENRGNYATVSIVICSACFAIGPCFWYGILKRDPVDSAEGGLPVAGKSLAATPAQAENGAAHTSGTSPDVAEETGAPHVALSIAERPAAAIHAQDPQMHSDAAGSATRKDAHMEAALDFLTGRYKPSYRWWESFRLTRTMTVSMVAVLSPVSYCPVQHAVQFLCMMGVAMAAQLYCQPYHANLLNKAENIGLGVVNLAMVGAFYVNSDSWSATPFDQVVVLMLSVAILFFCRSYLIVLLLMAAFEEFIEGESPSPDGAEHNVQDNKGTEEQRTASIATGVDNGEVDNEGTEEQNAASSSKAVYKGEVDNKGAEKESTVSMAKAADNDEVCEKV